MAAFPKPRFLDPSTPPTILTLTLLAATNALTMNVYLPSLPSMAEYFGTDYALMQLSVPLYLGMVALLQVIVGPISDRYGRKPVLQVSLVGFLLATTGCLLAPNIWVFLAFRLVQAVIAGGMVLSRAIVRDIVPGGDQAARMIAYITMGMALIPMIAPTIGGALASVFGWKASFWLLIIDGGVVLFLIQRDLGETHPRGEGSLRDQIAAYPELFKSQRFWGYALTAMFASGTFFSYLGGAPFVGSQIFELEPGSLGVYFGAAAGGYIGGNFISARYTMRTGLNAMMLAGAVVTTAGLVISYLVTLAFPDSPGAFFGSMICIGIGNGLVLPNANAGAVNVRPHLAGSASGLSGAIMLGGGAGVSIVAGLILSVESGPYPLIILMFLASALSVVTSLWVVRRAGALDG